MSKFSHTEQFISRLKGVRETANGWEARCPCRNDDDNPSLSVSEDESNGNILVTCHRGSPCTVKEICQAMGVTEAALFPPSKKTKEKLELVKTYDYTDEYGTLLFQKLRYIDSGGKKTFRQRKPDGRGGWEYSLGDTPKVLYNLPAVLEGIKNEQTIWVVEGEKDADTLIAMGLVATTIPGGAGKWLPINTESLVGAEVEIIADNDTPGLDHANMVYHALSEAGIKASIWKSPSQKDITDHLSCGHELDDLIYVEPGAPPPPPKEQDAFAEARLKIEEILSRPDLSDRQKLTKAANVALNVNNDRPTDYGRLVTWEQLLKETGDDVYDWCIDGLLEKGERVIVVAAEGVGKTMLARQVAILSALGVHPFTYQKMRPVRTLTVDLENPEKIIRRTSRNIYNAAIARGYHSKDFSPSIVIKPSGLDLLKISDREILESHIEEVKPELLVMGPLYKSFVDPGGRTSEAVAVEVAKYLDYIRDTYNCALWLEHHAPLGESMTNRQMRPFGSAVWSRWPEFGLAITQDITSGIPFSYDVRHFRGARDEREWPTKIRRGKLFPFEVLEFSKVTK